MNLDALTAGERTRLSATITADITEAIHEHRVHDLPMMLAALSLVDPQQAGLVHDTIRVGLAAEIRPPTAHTGVEAIAAERLHQIEDLGYTTEHDLRHSVDDFVTAAAAYLGQSTRPPRWAIKRADPDSGYYQRADLVTAGALIAAAIDRLDAGSRR